MELDDPLVEFSLSHIGSINEERNPVIASITVQVSGMEVVPIDEVGSLFVNIDNNVDLIARINVLFLNSLVSKSDESTFLVKSSIGSVNFVVSEPGEMVKNEFMGLFESIELVEIFNLLPFLIRSTLVENNLIDFQ